jgi:hypothetical protein
MKTVTLLRSIAAFAVLISSTYAQADIICRGKPTDVVVDNNAFVASNFGFGPIYFCNLSSDVNAPYVALKAACPAILSMLMTAEASGKEVGLYFVGMSNCTGIRASTGWAVQQPAQVYIFP